VADEAEALRTKDGRCILELEVKPGSKTQGFGGFDRWRGRFIVHVRARAQKGKANKEVLELLARDLGAEDAVIESGRTSHSKTVSFRLGRMSLEEVKEFLKNTD
jgi:uncharacterized protein (TIGR00251 family)